MCIYIYIYIYIYTHIYLLGVTPCSHTNTDPCSHTNTDPCSHTNTDPCSHTNTDPRKRLYRMGAIDTNIHISQPSAPSDGGAEKFDCMMYSLTNSCTSKIKFEVKTAAGEDTDVWYVYIFLSPVKHTVFSIFTVRLNDSLNTCD